MAEHISCAPLLSVTVSVTAVAPREYGEGGDWMSVIVLSTSGSKEPLSTFAGAVHKPGVVDAVTFLHSATGGRLTDTLKKMGSWFANGRPKGTPFAVNVPNRVSPTAFICT